MGKDYRKSDIRAQYMNRRDATHRKRLLEAWRFVSGDDDSQVPRYIKRVAREDGWEDEWSPELGDDLLKSLAKEGLHVLKLSLLNERRKAEQYRHLLELNSHELDELELTEESMTRLLNNVDVMKGLRMNHNVIKFISGIITKKE